MKNVIEPVKEIKQHGKSVLTIINLSPIKAKWITLGYV